MSNLPVPSPPTIRGRARQTTAESEPAKGIVPDYVRKLAWLLDDAIPFFGGRRIGIDGFLSFIPVVGEATGFGLAAIVVMSGVRAGASWPTILRMVTHAVGESVVGLIPGIGAIFAFFWKANDRNLRIIEANLRDREATTRESWKVLLFGVAMIVLLFAFFIAGLALAIYAFAKMIR